MIPKIPKLIYQAEANKAQLVEDYGLFSIRAHAAKLLRMQRTTLVEKLRKYGLQSGATAH